MDRAYSLLNIKAVDDGARRITGIATTPAVDRVGDIVESKGVRFRNPAPLLWQHAHDKPVGTVNFEKPTAKGVAFSAEIPALSVPGTLKDRVDEAWHSVRAGLVRAVSIGFRPIDGKVERLASGGTRFLAVEVIELSLVTIPANEEATISNVKRFDQARANEGAELRGLKANMLKKFGPEELKRPMSRAEVYGLLDGLLGGVRELAARISAVEGGGLKYAGTWQRAGAYGKGNVVTHDGSAWIALKATDEGARPGTTDQWQLMVKSGKDAR